LETTAADEAKRRNLRVTRRSAPHTHQRFWRRDPRSAQRDRPDSRAAALASYAARIFRRALLRLAVGRAI